MKLLPSILVVTPTLGTSRFLDRTLASIDAQPVPVRSVLVTPAAQVEALQARYPGRLVLPDAGPHAGLYGAINVALAYAPEPWDWFTYLNDDDCLLPGFGRVARHHLGLADPDPVAYGRVDLIDEADRRAGAVTIERSPAWMPALLQQGISPLMQQGTLFRRDWVRQLGGFDLRYRLCADLDFWLRAHAAGARFRCYDVPVAQFRLRGGQLSGDTAVTIREQDEIVARLYPTRLPAWRRHAAVWRYRARNLPSYLGRLRTRGLRTSYQILQQTP